MDSWLGPGFIASLLAGLLMWVDLLGHGLLNLDELPHIARNTQRTPSPSVKPYAPVVDRRCDELSARKPSKAHPKLGACLKGFRLSTCFGSQEAASAT